MRISLRFRLQCPVLLIAIYCAMAHATDYYVAYDGISSGTCTDPAQPCTLGYALGVTSGTDVRLHLGPTPSNSVYLLQKAVLPGDSFTMIGAGSTASVVDVLNGSPGNCALGLTSGTIVLQDIEMGRGSGCCARDVCVNAADGDSAHVKLVRTTINAGTDGGRGIDITTTGTGTASLDVVDSSIQNNGDGGIVFAGNGSINIDRSLFYHDYNDTSYATAPLQVSGSATTSVTNSTFTVNYVNGTTGGISHASSGLLTLDNVTLSGNTGYAISANVASIAHSIIQGACAVGGVLNGGYSVESPGNTCALAGTSQVNVTSPALALGALADNGGATQTLMPQPGSAAIGIGGAGCTAVDQRDYIRVTACDAGAVQADSTLPDVVFADGFD
jgi:hypothetical protein